MGLWSSISIVLGFSFLVVGADEWVHAVRAERRAAAGVPRAGH
jgi:heme/copper-type cytochrome/quinol oxidase subunit 3